LDNAFVAVGIQLLAERVFYEFIESDQSQDAIHSTTDFFYQTCGSQESPTSGEEIIDDDDILSF